MTSEQALADTAFFIDSMNETLLKRADGSHPDWFVIGGSYPGALSAWFKSQYPNHTIGAWSSSGVINAIYDYHLFDNSLFTSMSKSGADCPDQVVLHYTFIEEQFTAGTNIDRICQIFGIEPANLNEKDFFWFFADIYTIGVQYGNRTAQCDMLISIKGEDIWTQLEAVANWGV